MGNLKVPSNIVTSLGKIAGVAGIALGIFLTLFKGELEKKFLPEAGLTSNQAFYIMFAILLFTFGIAAVGLVAWIVGKTAANAVPTGALVLLTTLSIFVIGAAVFVGTRGEAKVKDGGPKENEGSSNKGADDRVARLKERISELDRDWSRGNRGEPVRLKISEWAPKYADELLAVPDDQLRLSYKAAKYEYAAYALAMAASTENNPDKKLEFANRSLQNSAIVKVLLRQAESSNDQATAESLSKLREDNTEPRVEYLMAMEYCIKFRLEHNSAWRLMVKQLINGLPSHYKEWTMPEMDPDLKGCA